MHLVPQATAHAGAMPADPEQQVPGERAEAGRVRERARRAVEPGAGPPGLSSVVIVHEEAVLRPPRRAGRPGRGRVPVHRAACQRARRRPAQRARPAQRPRQPLCQEGPGRVPVLKLIKDTSTLGA